MATCYYCTRPGVTKRWIVTSRGGSGRLYISKKGLRGGSVSRGATTAPRLLCTACAASHDKVDGIKGILVLGAILAFICFGFWANHHQPDYVKGGSEASVAEPIPNNPARDPCAHEHRSLQQHQPAMPDKDKPVDRPG